MLVQPLVVVAEVRNYLCVLFEFSNRDSPTITRARMRFLSRQRIGLPVARTPFGFVWIHSTPKCNPE